MKALKLIAWALLTGALLFVFTIIPGLWRYIFSLGAFFIGVRVFGMYESWKARMSYILASLVFFFLILLIYVIAAFVNEWPLPLPPELVP